MNAVDIRRYEMLIRVRDFGAAQAERFPPSSRGGQAFAAVGAAVEGLSQHVASQISSRSSTRVGTTSKAVAREALRDDLDAIIRTARAIAIDAPGFDGRFRLSRSGSDRALLNSARAFARDAAPAADQFVAYEMPGDFVEDLQNDIEDFEAAIRNSESGRDLGVAARASIEDSMEAGLDAIRRLDAIVPNRLRDDPATLAVWERARRVDIRGSRSKAEPVPPSAAAGSSENAATT